jgi:hypothetical protein
MAAGAVGTMAGIIATGIMAAGATVLRMAASAGMAAGATAKREDFLSGSAIQGMLSEGLWYSGPGTQREEGGEEDGTTKKKGGPRAGH